MSVFRRIGGVLAVGTCSVLALTACGGGSSNDTSTPAATVSALPPMTSSATAKIMVIGDFTSTFPFTVPEIAPTVKGVLRGFPNVTVETCDSKGAAGAYLACAQRAVDGKADAVIQGFVTTQDQSLLTDAGIPTLGVTDDTSPNVFPIISSFGEYAAEGVGLANTGCKKLGILYVDGSDFLVDYTKRGFESKGGVEVARAGVSANAPDLTPAVAKLTGAGAECVAVSLVPADAAKALTALRQSGQTLTIGSVAAIFSADLLESVGSLADGVIVIDGQLNQDDDGAGIAQVTADARAGSPDTKVTEQGITAWIAARLVGTALQSVQGEVTAASLQTALMGLTDVDMLGVIPPWNSKPLDSPSFARVFNHYGINYKIVNGKTVRSGDFYDIASILSAP